MATQTQTSESTSPEQTTPNTAPKKAKNHFKGFNAVIKTTNDLKKNVARKLGKGGNASDAQDINIVIARMQYLDSLVESLPKVVKSFKRESDLLKDLTDHQKNLLTQTTDFHQQMIKDKTESDTISPVVVETIQLSFCQLHTELFSLETSLVEAINETSSALLQTAGVPLAKEQYKKWDVVRQQAEEANKKLENTKKDKNAKEDRIKALETELATAKSALETADRETLAALETTIERIEVEYLNRIRSVYVEAYRKYFQQGQQLLKKVSDSLSDGADDEQLPTATAGEGSTAIQKKKKKKGKYNTTVWKAGAFLAVASAVAVAGYFLRMRK